MSTADRFCISCQRIIRGRADKKFCDDHCRSAYNNRLNNGSNQYIRQINNILRRNRRILEALLPASAASARIHRQEISLKGFHFHYFTHTEIRKNGSHCYFCYDIGYLQLAQDRILIIRQQDTIRPSDSIKRRVS